MFFPIPRTIPTRLLPLRHAALAMLSLLMLLATSASIHAQLQTPAGLVNGQKFRFVFVTSGKGDASSTNMATYDTFVRNAATAAGLNTYQGNNVNWYCLGYSSSVSVHTRVAANAPESIYRLDGAKIADNGADLWDGSIANPISTSELGDTLDVHVWTGFQSNGTSPTNGSRIWRLGSGSGNGTVLAGNSSATDSHWAFQFNEGKFVQNHFYAVSDVLTAVTNEAPTANAGENQTIRAGDTVYLDGSASFDDNTASAMLVYAWEFTSRPAGSNAALNDSNSVMPTFVADVAGTYELALVVTDEDGVDSEPALVSISSSNLAPTAVATVDFALAIVGTTSFFDGSASSDPELDEITYLWEITAAPMGSTAVLVDADTATPSLTTDVEGTYEVTLTVSDFLGPGASASVEFVATTPQNYAEIKILEASDLVQALLPTQVTSKGNQVALGAFLKNATRHLQNGNVSRAIAELNKALERTDGCALRGSPDGNGAGRDWVIDCDAQHDIYDALKLAMDLLGSVE
ncbi:MAG: PKD domain-containing protein [Pirellulaceae bacterium]|nr:PKD domain-containing protein [Pirellulaceae bacterium]